MATLNVPPAPSEGGAESIASTLNNADSDDERQSAMGYQQTLMYGRYSKSLGEYAKEAAKREKMLDKQRKRRMRQENDELTGTKSRGKFYRTSTKVITYCWRHTFAKLGEDWVFLAVLGIVMAVISYGMDYGIGACGESRIKLYNVVKEQNYHVILQFVAWCILPVFLVLFSAGFTHVMAPSAAGSGIPEMKTIMRGVILKEYLTVRTGIAKVIGLTATLGSGMPLGKEGPFVHIASIVATCLTKMVTTFQGIYSSQSRQTEMLEAACAVGVACCFAAPIGGVLFSIEVTSVFFAVRNYWRGFFAAICGATCFRLIFVFASDSRVTISPMFKTDFKVDYPYDPRELIAFAGIGVVCGLGGALYVYLQRRYVLWMRGNKRLSKFLQKNRFIYPFAVSFWITAVTFPNFLGQFIAAKLNTHDQIHDLFSNHSWTDENTISSGHQASMLENWTTDHTDVLTNLAIYIMYTFWMSILATTLPVPSGVLVPTFKIGAAFGRIVGESMNIWFPAGFHYEDLAFKHNIVPGGYATVGAAAFAGAVTHTISISIIVFEMTGQITHAIPMLISVLISNAIAALLQPSFFDSIIMIKKLPYLPDILPSSSKAYNVYVEDFMLRDVKFIWYGMTYKELRQVLKDGRNLRGFPLVDSPDSMILLGSIPRTELIGAIESLIGRHRRHQVAMQRYGAKLKQKALEEQRMIQKRIDEAEKARKLAAAMAAEEEEKKLTSNTLDTATPNKGRRPSRFEVTTIAKTGEGSAQQERRPSFLESMGIDPDSPAMKALIQLNAKPKKSILKKSHSATIHAFRDSSTSKAAFTDDNSWRRRFYPQTPESMRNNHRTVTGAEQQKWKSAIDNLQMVFKRPSATNVYERSTDGFATPGSVEFPKVDMTLEEQQEWEEEEMAAPVDFDQCHIDPAPFQLVEKTSLLKVHSLFSMVGVNHAYVTTFGRLIGVVGLTELRAGIENANSGNFPSLPMPQLSLKVEEKPDPESGIRSDDESVIEMITNRDDSNIEVVSDSTRKLAAGSSRSNSNGTSNVEKRKNSV